MLPRPFLYHTAKQTPWVALLGARAPLLPRGSYSPNSDLALPLLVQPGALSIFYT